MLSQEMKDRILKPHLEVSKRLQKQALRFIVANPTIVSSDEVRNATISLAKLNNSSKFNV